jgi:hypothetical protein
VSVSGGDRVRLNEHRSRVFGAAGGEVAYLCECGDVGCLVAVRLTREEYARRRPGVILAPGHEPQRAQLRAVRPLAQAAP